MLKKSFAAFSARRAGSRRRLADGASELRPAILPFCLCVFLFLHTAETAFAASAAPSAALSAAPSAASSAEGRPPIFLQPEARAAPGHPTHLALQPLWQRVVLEEKARPSFTGAGNFNRIDAESWRNLVKYAANMPEVAVLQMVNGYFNQWTPKSDSNAWTSPEYWDTPREFIDQRGGDCEDYAIAKYFALRFLGFEPSRLRLVIVRLWDEKGKAVRQLHAVLAVYCKNTWFILDNNARPRDNIFPHTQYQGRFEALYSMNENGAWLHGAEIARTSIAREKKTAEKPG
ncbi:MAG: transglutaminase-like cysteine peptidase [Desulfovibrio sp.]|nr:transglutaminase-like cysteine peptidase [Desulfovibrio sp.]